MKKKKKGLIDQVDYGSEYLMKFDLKWTLLSSIEFITSAVSRI